MFTHDVNGKVRNNKRLLPRRNWCSITEYLPGMLYRSVPTRVRLRKVANDKQALHHLIHLPCPQQAPQKNPCPAAPRTYSRELYPRHEAILGPQVFSDVYLYLSEDHPLLILPTSTILHQFKLRPIVPPLTVTFLLKQSLVT